MSNEPLPLMTRIKKFIGSLGWELFLWGSGYTAEQYWEMIYCQEAAFRSQAMKEKTE